MSFLKRLFGVSGGKSDEPVDTQVGEAVEHEGYTIRATPFKAEGQFQTCGVISKEIDGAIREHRFVRADRFAVADDAAETALRKARQIIREQGDRMFNA